MWLGFRGPFGRKGIGELVPRRAKQAGIDHLHPHALGADMPGDELVRFCTEHSIDVAVISLTNPGTADLAAATAERIRGSGTPAILGGPGRSLNDLLAEAKAALSKRAAKTS